MMRCMLCIGLALHLLLVAVELRGQQPDTLSLQEVEVSCARITAPQGSIPVQRIDAVRLKRLAGQSVADALRHFAGVHIKDYGGVGGLKTVQVRSLGAQHTSVFVDGVPLTEAASGQIDLGRLLIDPAEELSLSTGSSSELFVPARWYAQASALSLQTSNPDFSTRGTTLKSSLRVGSFGLFQPLVQLETNILPQTRAFFAARYLNTDGQYPYRMRNGGGQWLQRLNSDVRNLGFQAKIVCRSSDAVVDYGALFDHSRRGLPGAVTFYNPQASQRLNNTDLNQHVRLLVNRGSGQHQLLFRHAFMHLHYVDPDFLNQQGRLEQSYLQQEFYLSQLSGFGKGQLQIVVSNDFTLNGLLAEHLSLQPIRLSWYQLLAARWQNARLEANAHLLWLHAWQRQPTAGLQGQYHPLSPGLSMAWRTRHNKTSKIRLLFKETFRLPSFNELYYHLVGNPVLKPEHALMFNLGWVGQVDRRNLRLHWQLDAFSNKLTDKIIAIPTKNLFVWSMRNLGRVSSQGLEASLSLMIAQGQSLQWQQHLSYTWQKATDRSSATAPSFSHQIQYIPRHTLNSFTQISSGRTWMAMGLYFNSQRYFLPENIPANRLPAWSTIDLSMGYSLETLRMPISLKAELSNLLNTQYEIIRSFPMPGRAFHFSLSTQLP